MRAAGMMRPQAKTDPAIANRQTLEHEVKRHGTLLEQFDHRISSNESAVEASQAHTARVERKVDKILDALDVEDDEPDGESDPPPPAFTAKAPKKKPKKVDVIASDSKRALIVGYATTLVIIAKAIWDAWHGGGK